MGGSYRQEIDRLTLYKDVVSQYCEMVTVPEQLPNVLDRAIRVAFSQHAPAAMIIPSDVQELEYSAPAQALWMVPSSLGLTTPEITPGREDLRRAAAVLTGGAKVAILIGQGARREGRGHRGRRHARGRGGQGAARQGRAAGRPAVRHRLDRAARHAAVV